MVSVRILLGAAIAGFIVCSEVMAEDLFRDRAALSAVEGGEDGEGRTPLGEGD